MYETSCSGGGDRRASISFIASSRELSSSGSFATTVSISIRSRSCSGGGGVLFAMLVIVCVGLMVSAEVFSWFAGPNGDRTKSLGTRVRICSPSSGSEELVIEPRVAARRRRPYCCSGRVVKGIGGGCFRIKSICSRISGSIALQKHSSIVIRAGTTCASIARRRIDSGPRMPN